MIVGCYNLHLYCDTEGCPMAAVDPTTGHVPFEASEATKMECQRKARLLGWTINVERGLAFCPTCACSPPSRGRTLDPAQIPEEVIAAVRLDTSVDDLPLSVRSKNILFYGMKITTATGLLDLNLFRESNLLRIKNCGEVTVREILGFRERWLLHVAQQQSK